MNKRSFATLGVVALLAAASAFGQQKVRYDIPFEFHFLDKVIPAGQYDVVVGSSTMRNALSLECYASGTHVFAVTHGIGGGANLASEGHMVFNKYGETYFLSEVWTPGYSEGGALAKTKTERETARTTPASARITVPAQTGHVIIARR